MKYNNQFSPKVMSNIFQMNKAFLINIYQGNTFQSILKNCHEHWINELYTGVIIYKM